MEQREFQLNGGGQLSLVPEGEVILVRVTRPDDGRGLYKARLRGLSGELLLGTLMPTAGVLALERRLARSQLDRAGCWPVTGGSTELSFSFDESRWQREAHPERLVQDAVLHTALTGRTMLLRRQKDGFWLAAPFSPTLPFPLEPLFCFACVERINGVDHAVFHFDTCADPVPPHK